MEENFKRLAGQVARALNLSEQTVADYAESEESIKELAKAFKENRTKIDDTAAARVSARIKGEVEKALKDKGVEAPDFDKLSDGLDAVAAKAATTGGSTLSDEDALNLPAVKRRITELENEKMRVATDAKEAAKSELQKERQAFLKEQQDAKVEAAARAAIAELNPNLNPDSAKAQKQTARLVADIKSGNYKVEADGTLAPVDAEGKYLDNGAGGSKSFSEYVRDVVTSEYDLPAAQKRDAPGHGTPAQDTGVLKTKEEFDAAVVKAISNPAALEKLEADYPAFANQ
jgi:hypothetical protein